MFGDNSLVVMDYLWINNDDKSHNRWCDCGFRYMGYLNTTIAFPASIVRESEKSWLVRLDIPAGVR